MGVHMSAQRHANRFDQGFRCFATPLSTRSTAN